MATAYTMGANFAPFPLFLSFFSVAVFWGTEQSFCLDRLKEAGLDPGKYTFTGASCYNVTLRLEPFLDPPPETRSLRRLAESYCASHAQSHTWMGKLSL